MECDRLDRCRVTVEEGREGRRAGAKQKFRRRGW